MAQSIAPTPIIQNSIPVRYNPRVVVKPIEPDRVPCLPGDILYMIAQALPQPKQVFNLALASKATWYYLKPALYECEVTYEARLGHKYGGRSTASVNKYYGSWLEKQAQIERNYASSSDEDSSFAGFSDNESFTDSHSENDTESSNGEQAAGRRWSAELSYQDYERAIKGCDDQSCDKCVGRIDIEYRIFEAQMPREHEQFRIVGAMTALHWASIHGASALPVAENAIRAALAHNPSYINGLGLIERCFQVRLSGPRPGYRIFSSHPPCRQILADHPPPLFLALAHGNIELFQALIDAGADTSLLLGRTAHFDDRGTLVCSKIHWQCFNPDEYKPTCLFKHQIDADERDHHEFLTCQTIGHVAVQFGQTDMLQMLIRNGLRAQQGSRHLLHSAVLRGNLAAVKVLLAHDPSSIHSCYKGVTSMHLVPFMENAAGTAVPEGQLESMVSYLLEHGESLETPVEQWLQPSTFAFQGFRPLDSAFRRLELLKFKSGNEHHIITALRAVNLFINKGASWLPPLSNDTNRYASFRDTTRRHILSTCLEKTVLLVEYKYAGDRDLWNTDFDSVQYRSIRKFWAQTSKNLVSKACEALARGAEGDNEEGIKEMLHSALRFLLDEVNGSWQREGIVGWWALEAVGNLLRATAMEPCGTTRRAWKRILNRDYEAPAPEPDRKVKLIQDCEEIDGDKSEWAFLSEGITFAKTEAPFRPGKHQHRKYRDC